MKQYLRLFTLMGFFSALSLQNATAAAAAAASGAGDDEGTCSRLLKVANHELMAFLHAEEAEKAASAAASADLAAKFAQAAECARKTGTHFDPTHPIFPKVQAVPLESRSAAQKFVESLGGCGDWDVHKFNKERISNVGADRHLFNTVMSALGITATDHGLTIARVRDLAGKIYHDQAEKLVNINAVLGTIGPDTATGEDDLEHRIIHTALGEVLTLVEIADKALDDTGTWLQLLLDKISENKETGGGCMPGVLGRLVEVGLRSFSELATVSEAVEKINASVAEAPAAPAAAPDEDEERTKRNYKAYKDAYNAYEVAKKNSEEASAAYAKELETDNEAAASKAAEEAAARLEQAEKNLDSAEDRWRADPSAATEFGGEEGP